MTTSTAQPAPSQVPEHLQPFLSGAASSILIPVAWGEMDAFGHVNNAIYFRYMESARVAFIAQVCGHEWMNRSPASPAGPILKSVDCTFRQPVKFPDTLLVTSFLTALEADRFTLAHRFYSTQTGNLVAEGKGTIVSYDYANARKAPIPATIFARMEASLRATALSSPSPS